MFTHIALQRKRRFWVVILAAAAMLVLSACIAEAPQPAAANDVAPATTEATAPPEITITARDFAFDMPDQIPSSWVSLTLANEGEVNHHGIVMRLLDGVTVEDALAAMDNPDANQGDYSDLSFFLPDADPGSSNQATVEMAPGHWVIFSVSMDAMSIGAAEEPTPDFALGSIKEFDVVAADTPSAAPEADMTVTVGADDFDLPAEIAAGDHTIQIVNGSDADNGYVFFLKMEGDTTMDDVLAMFDAFFSGQEIDVNNMPVFHAVGGLMGYNLGDSYYTTVNLTPGNYTAISSVGGAEFPYAGISKDFIVPGE